MRTKDLKVGMEVAVSFGEGAPLRRALVLEVNTVWTKACLVFKQLPDTVPFRNSIAIAWKQAKVATWQPDVVKAAQIVSTWADYEAGQIKKQTKRAAEQEAKRLRLTDENRKLLECRAVLGINMYQAYGGVDDRALPEVYTVSLVQMHKLALELKQLRDDLQKLRSA